MVNSGGRKSGGRVLTALALALLSLNAAAIDASNRYRSPRNPERRVRASTELIVLHTTEAPARSSLNKVSDRGECHFCVTEEGTVYRIVDRDREAFHAGRSMWNGKEDVDKFSIGIECVGHHDKAMSSVQLNAIRTLVKELQAMYNLPDHRVVCHSHVAYGAPNKWHRYKHRGRKRCGMLFAMPSVRRQLGLTTRPAFDPDAKAGRLRQADAYLQKVLYGSTDTMRAQYRATQPASPAPKMPTRIAVPPAPKPAAKVVAKPAAKPAAKTAAKPAAGKPAKANAGAKAAGGAAKVHVVKAGETLTKISTATGVPVWKLRSLNGLKGDRLLVGQKLKLQ